jgi:transposase
MRTEGAPNELERRRRLAVQRVLEGYSTQEVAEFLGVNTSSVRRWLAVFRRQGAEGLVARRVPGRPRKLTSTQEKIALRWLTDSPLEHGFPTELWTASRLGQLIQEGFGVRLNSRYLSAWLRDRGLTPQKPQRVPRERNPKAIAEWLVTRAQRADKVHLGLPASSTCRDRRKDLPKTRDLSQPACLRVGA